jgi:Leucine-rich repeat (LRR) protein
MKKITNELSDSDEENTKDKYPKDSYICPKCTLPPKILSIKEDTIKIECKIDGISTLPTTKYLNDMSSKSYINFMCDICKKNCQKGFLGGKEKIFKYCYDCKQKICPQCIKTHKTQGHTHIVPCNKLNDKCAKHLGEDYILYCHNCHKNLCINCNSEEEHKMHRKEMLSDIEPSRDELKNILKLRGNLTKIKDNLEKQLDDINNVIYLFDNVVTTYQEHKTNYNNIINITELGDTITIRDKDKEIEDYKKQVNDLLSREDFQNDYLVQLNKKYNTELKNQDIETGEEICLNCKNIDDEGLKLLTKINFKSMKVLHLSDNNITNLDSLVSAPFRQLKELYLFGNNISNIDVMEHFPFKYLEKLSLGANNIADISVLSKVPFRKLKVLELWENQISNIDVFMEVPFKRLKELNLSHNKIKDLKAFEHVSLRRLEKLSLHDNLITNIDVLKEIQFKRIHKLYFENNKVDYNDAHNQEIIQELKKIEREIKY